MLKTLYKKAFNVRDGEITISFFMQLYIFLVITVLLIVKPTVHALFLSSLGAARLPYGYLMVALIAVSSSYFYTYAIKLYSFKKIAISTLSTFSLLFLLLAIALHFRFLAQWVLYVYYVLIALFAVVVTSQFWILANMVYNAREAKRLFGFIGAGAIAGGIFGGYLTTLVSASFGNKVSIFIAALLILICIPILQQIWRLRLRALSIYTRKKKAHQEKSPDVTTFKLIINSKHLSFLSLSIGVSVIVAKLVDFQFSDFAHRAIPNSDELASFLGFWFSTFNVVALIIQLFLTNKVLSRYGVTTTMLILPLSIALGCLLFLTFPELWVLILIKGLDGSFKQSINKAAAELSILPIAYPIKNQAKSFIDIVVDSVATGLAGFLLIFVIKGMDLDTRFVTILTLLFLFIWLVLIFKLRDAYFESFRSNLQSLLFDTTTSKRKLRKERTITSARKILKEGTEAEILTILNRLSSNRLNPLKPQIIGLLDHPSPKVKKAVLEQMYFYKENTAINKIRKLLNEEDDKLVYRSLQYLLHHTKVEDSTLFKNHLDDPNEKIATAALLCLAEEARNNRKLAERFELNQRIENQIKILSSPAGLKDEMGIIKLLLTIGHSGLEDYYYFINVHFSTKNERIVKNAITAAGITAHPFFIGNLIQFLENKKLRKAAIKSLILYGPEITRTILSLENDDILPSDVRRHLPEVVATFNTQNSIKILYKFLTSKDVITRKKASKNIKKLLSNNPNLRIDKRRVTKLILTESKYYKNTIFAIESFNILTNEVVLDHNENTAAYDVLVAREGVVTVLREQLEQSLETIFALLSLRYNQEDITAAYYGIKSNDQEAKINAIEFLDNLLHIQLKSNILPLLEFNIIEPSHDATAISKSKMLDEYNIVKMLTQNRGKRMKLAILNLIEAIGDIKYDGILLQIAAHKDTAIKEQALQVLAKLKDEVPTP